MKIKSNLFLLKTCSDILLKAGLLPATVTIENEDVMEMRNGSINLLLREIVYSGYQKIDGNFLMAQVSIINPPLTGTGDPLEWLCVFSGYLGSKGISVEDDSIKMVFNPTEIIRMREQIEKTLLPWITDCANIESQRRVYEKRVEQNNVKRSFFRISKKIKERPVDHHLLSLLRWHCGDKPGAMVEIDRFLNLLPDDECGNTWRNWLVSNNS